MEDNIEIAGNVVNNFDSYEFEEGNGDEILNNNNGNNISEHHKEENEFKKIYKILVEKNILYKEYKCPVCNKLMKFSNDKTVIDKKNMEMYFYKSKT